MTGKRPHDGPGEDGDSKRVRSNDGSPAPVKDQKAAAMEKIAALKAKMAAQKNTGAPGAPAAASRPPGQPSSAAAATPPPASPAPPASGLGNADERAAVLKKIADMKAKNAAKKTAPSASPVNGGQGAAPPPSQHQQQQSDLQQKLSDAKENARKRALELAANKRPTPAAAPPPPPPRRSDHGARGGLGVGLHPSLMGDASAPSKSKTQSGPKFSTTKGNQPPPAAANPYLATDDETPKDEAIHDSSLASRKNGERKSKALIFNQKGKFIAQANALKQQARMEEMKKRIAAETRKTEIEEAGDKAFLVPAPPDVEWWDEGLLPADSKSYDTETTRIDTADSIITHYIQHPVLLQAPQDRLMPAPKPMKLTKTEQKKLRRQRRTADHKEEQAKIRLGLVEPPPPKVKKSNMMRVLGEQAVKDPTAVEARVNREIAQRKHDHEAQNEERKLTKEQRTAKLQEQQQKDEEKGVKMAVFRVENLSSGKHRYQVDVNAKQNGLLGIVVLHPAMNLVIVEGGAHSIKAYNKLMLNRIKWSENTLPLSSTAPTTFTGPSKDSTTSHSGSGQSKQDEARNTWLNPVTEEGELKDLSANGCRLVWEGEERGKVFKRWYSRVCETDGEAREVLRRSGMENMWTLARGMPAYEEGM